MDGKTVEDRPITLLFQDLANGDKGALDRLVPLFYSELRKIAEGFLRHERPGHTLQPTALVNELYLRIIGQQQPSYHNRSHFMAVASNVMRQILVDHARTRGAAKRGGPQPKATLDEAMNQGTSRPWELVAVDDALRDLERLDPHQARLVELRFFGGFTAEESAEALHLPLVSVRRELRLAQAWLQCELDHSRAAVS
jgi:RNA polymerase sigma-70 factor (ECF subfamily)